jgi:hypothetical protein
MSVLALDKANWFVGGDAAHADGDFIEREARQAPRLKIVLKFVDWRSVKRCGLERTANRAEQRGARGYRKHRSIESEPTRTFGPHCKARKVRAYAQQPAEVALRMFDPSSVLTLINEAKNPTTRLELKFAEDGLKLRTKLCGGHRSYFVWVVVSEGVRPPGSEVGLQLRYKVWLMLE